MALPVTPDGRFTSADDRNRPGAERRELNDGGSCALSPSPATSRQTIAWIDQAAKRRRSCPTSLAGAVATPMPI